MELAVVGADGIARCWWCAGDPIYEAYHDQEWGRPIRDDQQLFALLMLEGFQAGLSWRTILHRRASFARAFANWDPEIIAAYGAVDIERLMNDPGIIRNRLKVNGTVRNAQAYLQIRAETGSFADYIWTFVNGQTITRPRIAHRGPWSTFQPSHGHGRNGSGQTRRACDRPCSR